MRASDKGFNIVTGRRRKKPWEHKAVLVLRLEQETFQRIRRLAQREKCSVSQAAEMLIRTADSEKIEPTLRLTTPTCLTKHTLTPFHKLSINYEPTTRISKTLRGCPTSDR